MRTCGHIRVLICLTFMARLILAQGATARGETEMRTTGENQAPNPGFELLNPAGNNFPMGWSAFKSGPEQSASVMITNTAHSGSMAVRLKASAEGVCGINSEVISITRGLAAFWFRSVASSVAGQNLVFYVIGVNAAGTEAAPRAGFVVPGENVGDGKWHQGAVQFDYRDRSDITGIILAPRVNESTPKGEGDWILDDVDVREGRRPAAIAITAFWTTTPILRVDRPGVVGVQITNTGDEPTASSAVSLQLPAEVKLEPGYSAQVRVGPLASQQSWRGEWRVTARQPTNASLHVRAQQGSAAVEATRRILFVERRNSRCECTAADGSWRHYPALNTLQEGNKTPLRLLRFLPSEKLPDSSFGIAVQLPRSHDLETIFAPRFLNDGNLHTYWSGRAHATAMPGAPDWIVVRLGRERMVKAVRLTPYWRGQGFPMDFQIQVALKSSPWRTVVDRWAYRLPAGLAAEDGQPVTFTFPPVRADRVRLTVTRFATVPGFYTDFTSPFECRLSEIEVMDSRDRNVALASDGGRVTCSATNHTYFAERSEIARAFPEVFKLGVKWIRVGQWGDPTCWSAVERIKGRYSVDPATEKAITECARRGVHVLYTLDYGNSLYEPTSVLGEPGPLWRQGHPFAGEGGPTTPSARQGFVNYCAWVAKHFKGRVSAYEIWNEENSWAWFSSPPDPAAYGLLIRDAARRIKEVDPHALVVFGGTAALAPTFVTSALQQGAGPYLDAIAFHPYGLPKPEGAVGALDVVDGQQKGISPQELGFRNYADVLAGVRRWIEPYCPKAQLWADEWNVMARRDDVPYPGGSELNQAKTLARFYVTNLFYDVHSFWWSLYNDNYLYEWALLRSSDMSRMPSFYTLQALCTLLSGADPDRQMKAELITEAPEKTLFTFKGREGSLFVAVYSALDWSQMNATDDAPGAGGRIVIHGVHPREVEGIDPLHGKTQRLHFTNTADGVEISGLLIRDYPLILSVR